MGRFSAGNISGAESYAKTPVGDHSGYYGFGAVIKDEDERNNRTVLEESFGVRRN